jgi:hypothetical protein
MITSNKQYQAATAKLTLLNDALSAPTKPGVSETIVKAARLQTQELIDDIQRDIDDYDATGKMKPSDIPIQTVDDLMVAPIRFRLASHLSIDRFARLVEVSPRQIIRYESQAYQNSSMTNFKKILERINIKLTGTIEPL